MLCSGLSERDPDYFSQRWLEYTGEPSADWREVFHPEDRARAVHAISQLVAGADAIDLELRLRGRDGEYRLHHFRIVMAEHDTSAMRWFVIADPIFVRAGNDR